MNATLDNINKEKGQMKNTIAKLTVDLKASRQLTKAKYSEVVVTRNQLDSALTEATAAKLSLQAAEQRVVDSNARLDQLLKENVESAQQFMARELSLHKLRVRKYRLHVQARTRIRILLHTF